MRIVTAQELESWLASGTILEKDARGPKVVALDSGLLLKIFHTRRHPVLARLQPAAKRFTHNAKALLSIGIAAPAVSEYFWLDLQAGLSACIYQPLPGHSIEQLYRQSPEKMHSLLPALASFIRQLHLRGIYFRSLHLGNILLLPDGNYGLIDILDMRFKGHSLNPRLVQRNFQHLRRYLERHKLADFQLEELIAQYRDAP
ncbi:lipopolysaccharide kinase InaA family protein [Pseudomonas sp. TMP25]|uniref:lipopolysaccharide kinase InaA family protein n=1 Tax=Pseudomonas sp. TMP25 TaxID=3136561 RepID=UPI003100BC55